MPWRIALFLAGFAVLARAEDKPRDRTFEDLWRERGAAVLAPAQAPIDVLVIGASHTVGPFGEQLVLGLSSPRLAEFAVCGASLGWWIEGRGELPCGYVFREPGKPVDRGPYGSIAPHRQAALASALASAPAVVVIALGANKGADMVAEGSRLLAKVPPTSRCVWVSPPPVPAKNCADYFRPRFPALLRKMEEKAGRRCELIETDRYLHESYESGCHFSNDCGKEWGRKVALEIKGTPEPPGACAKPR